MSDGPAGRDSWGARLATRWARLYTRGLPPDVRDARRAEIESDVFEQQMNGNRDGHARHGVAIAGRTMRGVIGDLAWRREERHTMNQTQPAPASGRLANGTTGLARHLRWLAVLPLVVAGPFLFFGILWRAPVQLGVGLALVGAAVAIWRAFSGRWPLRVAPR